MSFPVTWKERSWADGPSLLNDVVQDARAGRAPSRWLAAMVEQGALPKDLAVGLVAALLQRRDEAGAVTEAARLAGRLGHVELGELLLMSLDAFDTGFLLTADPLLPGQSVEDALLRAAGVVVDLSDDTARARLLPRLRNAGLSGLECTALVRHGTADEIRTWLPAVLIEGVPESAMDTLVDALADREEVREPLLEAFEEARPDARADLLAAITASDRKKALRDVVARLVPTLAAEA